MTVEAVLRLLIALCRVLEIRPEELAQAFLESDDCQEYFDLLLALTDA